MQRPMESCPAHPAPLRLHHARLVPVLSQSTRIVMFVVMKLSRSAATVSLNLHCDQAKLEEL